jgi:intracellular septation protein
MTTQATASTKPPQSAAMQILKLVVEIGPLIIFFVVNSWTDIFIATGAFMAATFVSLLVSLLLFRKIPTMPLVSAVVVFIMGGLTLYLQDDLFIKLKPTITNTLFAAVLLGGLAFGTSLLKYLFEDVFQLREEGWRKLTFRWAIFFLFLAVLNEIVWRNFSTDFWLSFKLFGIGPLTLIFSLFQINLMQRYQIHPSADNNGKVAGSEINTKP